MNAAARVVSGTRKYDHGLRQLHRAALHWLDVADRVTFKLCISVFTVVPRTTCPSCVRWSPKSPNDSTFVRPAVVRSPWLVRPSGTPLARVFAIQNSASPASVAYLRHICFSSTRCTERIRGAVR